MKQKNARLIGVLICLSLMSGPLASAASAGLPCQLTTDDLKSLAASPAKLTTEMLDQLTDHQKKMVCQTRAFYQYAVREKGKIKEAVHFTADYLTTEEYSFLDEAVNNYILQALASHSAN